MEWTKKTWQVAMIITLCNLLLSGMIAFAVNALSTREQALQGAASTEYVDKQDNATRTYIDSQDNIISNRVGRVEVNMETKADKDDFDRLYLKTEDNNKLLIQVLKEIKRID